MPGPGLSGRMLSFAPSRVCALEPPGWEPGLDHREPEVADEIEEKFGEEAHGEIHCGCGEEIPEDHTFQVFHLFYDVKEHNLDIRLL